MSSCSTSKAARSTGPVVEKPATKRSRFFQRKVLSPITLSPARLVMSFSEEFGSGNATTVTLNGRAYGPTNSVLTRAPALS